MLDIHKLNIFLVAAETLNFTHTAQKLSMTQPSVSQHIQALEEHFHTPLFLRAGRHLELTDAGQLLYPLAREAVKLSIHIDETLQSIGGEIHGHLRVGCSTTPGKYILPNLLAGFHRQHPNVKVTCQVQPENSSLELLADGYVHVTMTSMPEYIRSDVEAMRFTRDRIILISPINHPWAEKKTITLSELADGVFIMREEDSGTYNAVNNTLRRNGIETRDLDITLTLGNSEAIALSVHEGIGVGFVSEMVVDLLGKDKVAKINIKDVDIYRDIFVSKLQQQNQSIALQKFWAHLECSRRSISDRINYVDAPNAVSTVEDNTGNLGN